MPVTPPVEPPVKPAARFEAARLIKAQPDYDLIVVGASFAGLIAARTAAHRGLKVGVLDAKREPGARVRTTGVLVKEAAEEIDIPASLTRKINGVRLYAPNHRYTDLFAPGYYFLATDTAALMRWLAREAQRAGADLLFGTRFEGAHYDGPLLRLSGCGLSARYLLGADGAKSRVAQHFNLGRNRDFLIGLETEYDPFDGIPPDLLHCFIDSTLAPGYLGWVIPGAGMTQIGLAVSPKLTGTERRPDYNRFLSTVHPLFPGLLSIRERNRRSGPIPCGGLVHPLSTRQVLLTGDAAGLVSPLTAGGIRLAFHYGRQAGFAIASHLQDGGIDPGAAMAKAYPRFASKKLIRQAWSVAPPNAVLNATLFTPPMRALARQIYFQTRRQPATGQTPVPLSADNNPVDA
ncbi:MAG: NAD(P)/FAD-dependent oxidoreductase [Pseudomonadota bacterium]